MSIENFYDKIPKKFLTKYNNPNINKHGITIPFRMLIVGGSGSGKTNTLINIIKNFDNTFNHIILCVQNIDEPLYQYLRSLIPESELTIAEGIANIPNIDDLSKRGQQLIVFDDLVNEKNQQAIIEYFIRGRKIGKGISCVYLTQTYFGAPKTIRVNCNYILLKKLSSTKDLSLILSDYNLGIDKDLILRLYKYATDNQNDFLLVDIGAVPERRFRKSFREILIL